MSEGATLSLVDAKWQIHFDTKSHKDSTCAPDGFDATYKSLTELGIAAGTWASKSDGFAIDIPATGQKFVTKSRGSKESLTFYRVLDTSDAGIVVATNATSRDSSMASWSLIVF